MIKMKPTHRNLSDRWQQWAGLFFLALTLLAGCAVGDFSGSARTNPELELRFDRTSATPSGTWTARLGRLDKSGRENLEHIWFTVTVADTANRVTQTMTLPSKGFTPLFAETGAAWPGVFEVKAEAGVGQFRGDRDGDRARGEFTITPDAQFGEAVAACLRSSPKGEEWLWLILQDVRLSEIKEFARADAKLTLVNILRLRMHGVTPEYLSEVRQVRNFSVDDIIRLRSYGVPGDFPLTLQRAGYSFDTDGLVRLRSYGVQAAEAAAWKEAGFNFDADDLVKVHSYGAQPAFGKAVAAAISKPSPDQLIKLRSYGVTAKFMEEVLAARPGLTVDELVQLQSYGVPSNYIAELHQAGCDYSIKDLLRLRSYRVPVGEIVAWKKAGFTWNADELTRLRSYGVTPGIALAARGVLHNPAAEDLIKIRASGISEEFMAGMLKADPRLRVDDIVHLRTYGVTPEYVSEWRKAEFSFGAKDLATLRTHGVPAEYAMALHSPTHKALSVEGIVKLRQKGLSAEEIRQLRE